MLHSLFKNKKTSSKSGSSECDSGSCRSSTKRAKQNGRRLDRAKNIRGLWCSDDDLSVDASRSSCFSDEHSPETFLGSTWGTKPSFPSNLFLQQQTSSTDAYSPLPSPPSSSISVPRQLAQSPSTLSSPRSWDGHTKDLDGTSGYSSDSATSSGSFESSASHGVFSAYVRGSEGNLQDFQGMGFGRPGMAALPRSGVQAFAMYDTAQKSAPNSRHTSPLTSPTAWDSKGELNAICINTHTDRTQKSALSSTSASPKSTSPRAWGFTIDYLQQGYTPTSSRASKHHLRQRWPNMDGIGMAQDKTVPSSQPFSGSKGQSEASCCSVAHPLPLPPLLSMTLYSPSPPSSFMVSQNSSRGEQTVQGGKWLKGHLLGSGAFGKVYKGIHSETGEFCAIKEVEYVEDDLKSSELAKQRVQEIMLLSSLRHPNIVHYKGSEMVEGHLNIYLEFVAGGSIYKLYQEFKKLKEPVIRRYTRQILQGLHFLHSKNTIHRDIKCANILVDQEGIVKLADFGMAKQIKEQGTAFLSFKGSPYWMAPEVVMQSNTGFAHAVDIWSLGCTVLEMVTGKPPWSDYEGVAAMFKISRAEIPPIPDNLSLEGQSFIKLCLQRDPANRPSAAALLQHPFVQIPKDSPVIKIFDAKETSSHPTSSSGLLRGGSRPLSNSIARSQPDMPASRSAPASPKSSYTERSQIFPLSSVELPRGFATPPACSIRETGFDFDMTPGKSMNGYRHGAGRASRASNGVPVCTWAN